MNKYTLKVNGMMCPKCEARVVDAVKKVTDAKKVAASHKRDECTLVAESADEEALRKAIADAGYEMTSMKAEPYGLRSLFGK